MGALWQLDTSPLCSKAKRHLSLPGKQNNTRFSLGEKVSFWTGYNRDIRAAATIKHIDDKDIYVYLDCYWCPIQDDEERKIERL